MHTRVRYKKVNDNRFILESNNFEINKCKFYVYIDILNMSYDIIDQDKNFSMVKGYSNSLNHLKRLAKQSLIDLGIEFKSESRLKKDDDTDDWELTNLKDYPQGE